MQPEVHYIASELEALGRQILAQCEEFPEYILHWPPPFPQGCSLFSLALEAITIIEEWILVPISGMKFSDMPCSRKSSIETFIHLHAAYEQWIQEVHTLVDTLPSSMLDCAVPRPFLFDHKQNDGEDTTLCIRFCLLHALVEISIILGKMQTLRHLLFDGERMLVELTEQIL